MGKCSRCIVKWKKWISKHYIQLCACVCESVFVCVCALRGMHYKWGIHGKWFSLRSAASVFFNLWVFSAFSTIACFVYMVTHAAGGRAQFPAEDSFLSLWWRGWDAWIDSLTRITQSSIVSQRKGWQGTEAMCELGLNRPRYLEGLRLGLCKMFL